MIETRSTRDARWLGGLFAAAVLAAAPGRAHALSCDGRLVSVGDSEAYVRSICGEPTLVETRTEMRTAFVSAPYYGYAFGYAQSVPVQIDVLVYDFGPTRFVDELTFENGVLRADRIAGYGTVAAARARREARRAERAGRARDDE